MADATLRARIIDALEQESPAHGIDIVDVEITGGTKAPVVGVRIDHADEELPTITLDEIAAQNGWIGDIIDEIDPFPGSYTLEVSSPGMARPLRKARDFERFAGETVQISYVGQSREGLESGKNVWEVVSGGLRFAVPE